MRIWFALLVAPLLALADQSISFATVDWACAHQLPIAVHAVHVAFIIVTAMATLAAWQAWRESHPVPAGEPGMARRYFLSALACASGTLSMLAIVAMWIPTWIIAPCSN